MIPLNRPGTRSLAIGLLCAVAAPLAAQSPFAKALPDRTLAFVSFPDLDTSIQEFQQMPLAKMWREDRVQDFFADALKLADDTWNEQLEQAREQHAAGMLPFDPDELVKARLYAMSFALTEFAIHTVPDSDPVPHIGLLMHFDFGDTAPIWRHVIETGLEMMVAEAGDDLQRSAREVAGATIHTFAPVDEPGLEMSLNVSFVGNGVVVGSLTSDVEAFLPRLSPGEGGVEGGLAATAEYQALTSHIDLQGAEAEFFVRPGTMIDSLVTMLDHLADTEPDFPTMVSPQGLERALTALGLRSIDAIGTTSSYVGDRCVTRTFVSAPKERRQGLLSGGAGTLDMGFLRWIPADAVSFSAFRMDTPSIYEALESAIRAYDPNLGEMLLGELAKKEEELGVSLKEDLFGAFGNQGVFWSMPMAAFGAAPEIAMIAEVKDPARLVETLRTVTAMTDGAIEMQTVERRGITVHQFRFDVDVGPGGPMMFNPADMFMATIGFRDNHMVLGLSTGDVKRAFARMEREDDPTGDIRSNPEFAPWLEQIPQEGLSALSFTDWKSTFESYYQMATSVLAIFTPTEDMPFDLSLLPDSATLTQHLFASVSWSRAEDGGFYSEAVSPFGPEIVVLAAGGMAAGGLFMAAREIGPMIGTTPRDR